MSELKHVVVEKLEIHLEAVLDMYGNRIEEEGGPLIASSWPYYQGKFTIIGAPLFSKSLLTQFMSQLRTAGELATLGFSPSHLDSLFIEGGTSSDLLDGLLSRISQVWPNASTLSARTGDPSVHADNGNHCTSAARTFIVVQTWWIKFPDKGEQPLDVLMRTETTISEVKSSMESYFFEVMRVSQQH
ncbi:hypothetical protein FN846DRAFT_910687 [Sphaerosporella brunnea]|uniref:Uncharacterized protein n=1 Tax=Sphaerosporella brunnea TaxID=1250544 RepID=A0A5J5EMY6_9PEZI|nr:hypothetical protein FN846DRAFT_910687 [Sphaerosporella brunnea]